MYGKREAGAHLSQEAIMISLADFPRPKDDNGRGLHWSASPYHLSGHELDFWMNELQAMKIKWVKVIDDGGGSSLELCGRLVDIGIMPVVRLYIGNPGHVQPRNLEAIRRLIDVGAFYFETNNEPDLALEWPDNKVPKDWLQIVVDNFIYDATEIINLGGFPAFPAMGVGTIVNPFELIVQRRRQDLFENGAWLAIHNYVLNHPLDYPYDEVNQRGRPLTQEEYDQNRWGWDQDKIETINRLRKEGVSSGETIHEDATCWLAYSLWNEQLTTAFGHSVPIMSTEGGVVIGDRQDGRYPRNDAKRHQEVTLWIQDFLLNSAPAWYFTVFHWLIANNAMGQNRPGWETQAWYGNWWDKEFGLNGHLPTVDALKGAAARNRGDALADGLLRGIVLDNLGKVAVGRRISAVKDGRVVRETVTSAMGQYRLWGLPPGAYALTVEGVTGFPASNLSVTQHSALMQDLTLPGPISGVGGRIVDSNGAPRPMQTVNLYQGALFAGSTVTEKQGYYGFTSMASGVYRLEVTGAVPQQTRLDGLHPATLDFTVPADQKYELRLLTRRLLPKTESQGRHAFYGQVLDEAGGPIDGVKIEMSWTDAARGTVFPTALTGADAGKARGYFEFIHTGGEFRLRDRKSVV
jgi:protocatechuate 3,4-dioxygenase beta subunit